MTIVVSGPSGAGKSTLCREYTCRREDTELMVTTTTRAIRSGEEHGKDYFFVSEAEFEAGIERGDFLEYARVHDHYYGSPRRRVEETWSRGHDVILEIDVQGGLTVVEKMPHTLLLFVIPSDLRELRRRLVGRGTDDPDGIRRRLETARNELVRLPDYHYFIFNDNLEDALEQFDRIVSGERCRIARYDVSRMFSPHLLDPDGSGGSAAEASST